MTIRERVIASSTIQQTLHDITADDVLEEKPATIKMLGNLQEYCFLLKEC